MSEVYLLASSMLTPIGKGVNQVHCAVEAGINRYQETDILSVNGNPIRMALAPPLAIKTVSGSNLTSLNSRQRRLLYLASAALNDLKHALPDSPIPMFITGPEAYTPNCGVDRTWIKCLGNICEINLDAANSRFTNIGRAGTADMVDIATRYFEATRAPYAVVGGVDSFYHVATLDFLEDQQRLLTSTTPCGFIPGEGSAFLLLASRFAPTEKLKKSLACIQTPSMEYEQGSLDDIKESMSGLGKVFNHLANHCNDAIEIIYSSENGEPHFSRELATAIMRNKDSFTDNLSVIRPAECFGDVGAAFGAIAISLAAEKLKRQNSNLPIIVACTSDSGARAALSLRRRSAMTQRISAQSQTILSESV